MRVDRSHNNTINGEVLPFAQAYATIMVLTGSIIIASSKRRNF